eukprot:scpid24458/ scgid22503/ 
MEFLRIAWGSLALLILLTCAPHMPNAIGARREEYDEPEEPDYGEEDEEEQDRDDQYGDEENGGEEEGEDMLVLPPVPADSCFRKDNTTLKDITPYIKYTAPLPHDGRLVVLDRVFTRENVDNLRNLLQYKDTNWVFTGFDPEENVESRLRPESNAPWKAVLPAVEFTNTDLWQSIQRMVSLAFPSDGELLLADVVLYVLRWGDQLKPDLGDINDKSLIAQIYVDDWKRNYYGETLLFNDSATVAASIHPRIGRMAIFTASARRLLHPPAIDYTSAQHIIELRMGRPDEEGFDTNFHKNQGFVQGVEDRKFHGEEKLFTKTLKMREDSQANKDVEEHHVKTYTASSGNRVMVLDGYLDEEDVTKLRLFMLHRALYRYDEKNLMWTLPMSIALFRQSRLFDELQSVVSHYTGAVTYHPYSLSCSLTRLADQTSMLQAEHLPEHGVSLSIFLNPGWTKDMFGETVFFESRQGKGNDVEAVAAVRPRFGRIAIFQTAFNRSCRPSSPTFQGAQYILTVNYAASRSHAFDIEASVVGSEAWYDKMITPSNLKALVKEMHLHLSTVENDMGKREIVKNLKEFAKRVQSGDKITGSDVKKMQDEIDEKVAQANAFRGL